MLRLIVPPSQTTWGRAFGAHACKQSGEGSDLAHVVVRENMLTPKENAKPPRASRRFWR